MKVLEFLGQYWEYISSGIVIAITIFAIIIKKRPSNKIYDPGVFQRVLTLVLKAESKFGSGHGEEKLQYVIDHYHLDYLDEIDASVIKSVVEIILCSPQKKGVNYEKVK